MGDPPPAQGGTQQVGWPGAHLVPAPVAGHSHRPSIPPASAPLPGQSLLSFPDAAQPHLLPGAQVTHGEAEAKVGTPAASPQLFPKPDTSGWDLEVPMVGPRAGTYLWASLAQQTFGILAVTSLRLTPRPQD